MAGNKGTISRSYDQAVQLLIMAASGIDAMAEGHCPLEVARGRLQAASKTLAGVVAMLVGDDRQAAQLLLEGFVLIDAALPKVGLWDRASKSREPG